MPCPYDQGTPERLRALTSLGVCSISRVLCEVGRRRSARA
ncbi:hypothetical protein LINPERPRIM_LOCUS44137 [Linum perenne]